MKNVLFVLAIVVTVAFAAGSIRLENPEYFGGSDDLLAYDDGTPYWIWYGSEYSWGVWFDINDFMPGAVGFECNFTEFWFYHHTFVPWEIDDFYAELWNADELFTSPVLLDQSDITAVHYAFVSSNFTTIATERDFWVIANVERTTNGSPTPMSDNTENFTGTYHSFAFPGGPLIQGGHAVDLIFHAGYVFSLDSESWGAIKGLYR